MQNHSKFNADCNKKPSKAFWLLLGFVIY